jgi:hypothetical protein
MTAKRLGAYVGQAGLFQAGVARGTAIDHTQLRKPYLLDAALKVPLQGDGIAPAADQREILVLVMPPFAEIILGRSNGQGGKENDADHTKGAHTAAKQSLPQCADLLLESH